MENRQLTLMDLLNSRENRVFHQKELLDKYDCVLVSMTLNIPGAVKDKPEYRRVLREGMKRMETLIDGEKADIKVLYSEVRELVTGPEGYICVSADDPAVIKKMAVSVEEADMLGRLFDIDVITKNGGISRSNLGAGPRKCLICDEDAKVCARGRTHEMGQLIAKIDEIIAESVI